MDHDDGRPHLDKDDEVRIPRALLREKGVSAGTLNVYAAIRARAGFEPAADNFLIAWPAVETIAAEAGVSRATAIRAAGWLVDREYLIIWRRPNRPSIYGIVTRRHEFLARVATDGRYAAIQEWDATRCHLGRASRASQAEAAARGGNARPSRRSARKSHARDGSPSAPGGSHACDPGGSTDATAGGITDATRSVVKEICGSDIRGATDAAQPAAALIPSTDNGHHPHQQEIMAMVASLKQRKEGA